MLRDAEDPNDKSLYRRSRGLVGWWRDTAPVRRARGVACHYFFAWAARALIFLLWLLLGLPSLTVTDLAATNLRHADSTVDV